MVATRKPPTAESFTAWLADGPERFLAEVDPELVREFRRHFEDGLHIFWPLYAERAPAQSPRGALRGHLPAARRRVAPAVDGPLVADLCRWIADALARHLPPTVIRDPDGTWWWGAVYLGRDNLDCRLGRREASHAAVIDALSDALEIAADRLDNDGARAVHEVLDRLRRWRASGVW